MFRFSATGCTPASQLPARSRPEIQVLRRRRHASGFWTCPPFEAPASRGVPEEFKVVRWPDLGVRLVYQVSGDILEGEYTDVRYREFSAIVQDLRTFQVYGVIELCLTQAPGSWYTNRAYADALAFGTEDSAAFGDRLSTTCASLANVFSHGRTIAKLARLEMLPDTGVKGIGIEIATRTLALVRQRFGMVAFLLQPFPLQYTKGAPNIDAKAREKSWARFEAHKAKLVKLYETTWGAQHLHGGYMVASLTHPVSVTPHTRKWQLAPARTYH